MYMALFVNKITLFVLYVYLDNLTVSSAWLLCAPSICGTVFFMYINMKQSVLLFLGSFLYPVLMVFDVKNRLY